MLFKSNTTNEKDNLLNEYHVINTKIFSLLLYPIRLIILFSIIFFITDKFANIEFHDEENKFTRHSKAGHSNPAAPNQNDSKMNLFLDIPALDNPQQHNNKTEQRKASFRKMTLLNSEGINSLPILAYEGFKINELDIENALSKMKNEETGDFTLAQLVRMLYFTRQYDQEILPELKALDYWLTKGENQYCYWSENHMILWMSSAYLLKQREGWEMDSSLEKRLRHFLDLKINLGFYEFFSSTYNPFTLAGLLNLADFAKDEDIRNKAEDAAKILMKQMLLVFNENGSFYPASGRNHSGQYKYFEPSSIMLILTGLGEKRTSTDYIGAFLSTSSIELYDVANTWTNSVDTRLKLGHEQYQSQVVHAGLLKKDRVLFQWSSGGYFHPLTADDSKWIIGSYKMEEHDHFKIFKKIPNFPDDWSSIFTKIGATWSRGSSISHATIDIYKNKGVVLTSLQNFYGGYVGYQQWPWAATVEHIAVWTQSGEIKSGWPKSGWSANSHLPRVFQKGNAAMIVYNPNLELSLLHRLGKYNTTVSLYWPRNRFDETFEWKNWVIGKKDDSYIAVYRYGKSKKKKTGYYSQDNNGRQLWAVIVGNSETHKSFKNFFEVIKKSSMKESYEWSFEKLSWVYSTEIQIDGKLISQTW
jgi:hypothetical protein